MSRDVKFDEALKLHWNIDAETNAHLPNARNVFSEQNFWIVPTVHVEIQLVLNLHSCVGEIHHQLNLV